MSWKAREITIVVSLGLHALIAAAALNAAHDKKLRRATTVSLADEKKKVDKKPEPPKPPPPKPAPPKAAPKPAAAPAPAPVEAPAPAPASAPLATNISMGNEVGMETGGPREPGAAKPSDAAKPQKPAAAPVKTPIHVDAPAQTQAAGAACTEPPGKPEPAMKTDIEYTEEARAAGIEGRLVLEVTVDADGLVTNVAVITGVDPALDSAAIATVKTWRFKPALACGKPVAGGKYRIARRFELGD